MVVEAKTKTQTIERLRTAQANVMLLYLNAKRRHWCTYGPLFRELHLLFDEIAIAARDQIDPFAERARILGGEAISAPEEISATATIPAATGKPSPVEMLRATLDEERRIIEEMREAVDVADEEGDPGSSDLFSQSVQAHEKYAWFIEESLRQQDGIVSS